MHLPNLDSKSWMYFKLASNFTFSCSAGQNARGQEQVRTDVQKGPSVKTASYTTATAATGIVSDATRERDGHVAERRPGHQTGPGPPTADGFRGEYGVRHELVANV